MPLYWKEELSELCHVLSHLSFWSICFLKGDLLLAPSDSPGCQPHCAHCCGRIGARWHKQRKRGMLPFFRNGHSLRRTVYPIPQKGWRDGGDTTRPSQKRRARPLQNRFSQILFDYVEETTYLEQVALFCTPKSVYQSDVVGLDFSEADSQCDQSNSGLLPGKGVRCPRLG